MFWIILLSNLFTLRVPDEGYSRNIYIRSNEKHIIPHGQDISKISKMPMEKSHKGAKSAP